MCVCVFYKLIIKISYLVVLAIFVFASMVPFTLGPIWL